MGKKTIKELKKGTYFKTVNKKGEASKTVYVKGDYNREYKEYACCKAEDICAERNFKSSQAVTTDFEY